MQSSRPALQQNITVQNVSGTFILGNSLKSLLQAELTRATPLLFLNPRRNRWEEGYATTPRAVDPGEVVVARRAGLQPLPDMSTFVKRAYASLKLVQPAFVSHVVVYNKVSVVR
jgi:hypothetical protein